MSVNKIVCSIVILGALLLGTSCSKENNVSVDTTGQQLQLSFKASMDEGVESKTTYDVVNHIGLWKREDMAGVIASYSSGSFTDARMQNFSIEQRNRGGNEFLSSATFTGKLSNYGNRTYTYYAVYPYTAFQSVTNASSVASRLEERQYPDLRSWDGACDMLASKPVTITSSSVAAENLSLQFTRLFGMLRLRFGESIADTSAYGKEIVETISIESVNAADKLAGKFTVNLASNEAPDPVISSTAGEYFNKVTLDYRGKNAPLSSIDAYFILNPGVYSNVTISVKTKDHTITLQRTGLTVNRGCVASATMNWKTGDTTVSNMPLLPKNPSTLKIMTFGHSYVLDSMEYIDDLLNNAGIKNVTYANFYVANCSLQTYWSHVINSGNTKSGSDKIAYMKRYYNGSTVIEEGHYSKPNKTIIDGLCDEKWDVVVLQTAIEDLGYYNHFASYLQKMIEYVKTTCQTENAKTPIIVWHMFWAFGSHFSMLTAYYGSQILNYEAHVQVAKEIMRNTDIQLIIPTGTAIQSLRQSKLNNPYNGSAAYEFTRDGCHVDYMAGRYTAACTWFEFFLKPCFGKTVLGNTFMPSTSYPGVPVTAENRESFQRAAILACQSPFEIAHLDAIAPLDVTGTTETFSDGAEKSGSTESFTLVDNLNW